jgi:hypothetical protein
MFLKIATVLAILGLALSFIMAYIQQIIFTARLYGPGLIWITRIISFTRPLVFEVPLIIFFVAFLLSLRQKES